MQNYEHTFKYGDTGEPIVAVVKQDSDGNPPDWTGATVRFILYEINADSGVMTIGFNKAGGVQVPVDSSGTLIYNPETDDLKRVGRFPALFKVTKGSLIEHYPRDGFMWLTIEEIPESTP